MHLGTLRALEFDRIIEVVRGLAATPLGEARLSALAPTADGQAVESALALTTEAARFLVDHSGFPLRASRELGNIIDDLAVEGRALEAPSVVALATFLESVEQCGLAIRRAARGDFPRLAAIAATVASFEREVAEVRRTIDPAGEVLDHASPELRSIRDRLRKQRARLRGTLESYLRGKDTAKYLQDQVVTDRNGRYVLLVRAEHRGAIPGIVHGSSASGASLFLEPLSTVEINNDIVSLQEQEAAEDPADPPGLDRRVPQAPRGAAVDARSRGAVRRGASLRTVLAHGRWRGAPAVLGRPGRTARRPSPAPHPGGRRPAGEISTSPSARAGRRLPWRWT